MKLYTTNSTEETISIARQLAQENTKKKPWIVTLSGDLGSGKTTFVRAFLNELNVNQRILSPTFTIVREYSTPSNINIYHYDLYRIEEATQITNLDLSDKFSEEDAIILIEWPELVLDLLPNKVSQTHITFTVTGDDKRQITIL